MSYLELPAGLADFDKAVISLWFRVPDATLQAVRALPDDPGREEDTFSTFIPPLYKIIPLITFGSVETALGHQLNEPVYSLYPISPSFIGVDCSNPYSPDKGLLAVNLQMSNSTTFSSEPIDIDDQLRPDAFYMSGYGTTPFTSEEPQKLEVTPDQWHHILISFDLSVGCSCHTASFEEVGLPPRQITPGPTFTWAFDDEDKVGPSMGPSGGAIYISPPTTTYPMTPIPPESIIPSYLFDLTRGFEGITATWSPVPLRMEHSIGSPTAAQFVDNVYPVELAELQFFGGVTMDARLEANRRAFISASSTPDPEDPEAPLTGGTPVPPIPALIDNPDYDPGQPVSPSNPLQIPDPDGAPAEKLLGQPPDILFHGSGNWSIGKNTGPMIDNPDYDPGLPTSPANPVKIPDPDKQFTPTGQIVAYKPDPSLHGPQSPEPPPAVRLHRRMAIHA
jgi:hypothetical protein